MSTLTEGIHATEFILSEGNGSISREEITLDSTATAMVAGTAIGKMANGNYKAYANANSSGDADACAGFLYAGVPDKTTTQKAVMMCRLCELKTSLLTGADTTGKADLASSNVIFR